MFNKGDSNLREGVKLEVHFVNRTSLKLEVVQSDVCTENCNILQIDGRRISNGPNNGKRVSVNFRHVAFIQEL